MLVLTAGLAHEAKAQVFDNPALRTLDINKLRASRGSYALNSFRLYSAGSDRFSLNYSRTQPDPLSINNVSRMGLPTRPTPLTVGLGLNSRSLSMGTGNRASTYLGENRLSNMQSRASTFQPRRLSSSARGFAGGAGPSLDAGASLSTGSGLNSRARSGNTNSLFMQPQGFTAPRRPTLFTPRKPTTGKYSLSQRTPLVGRNQVNTGDKTLFSEKETYSDRGTLQQRIGQSVFGADGNRRFGRINRFFP
jgi:hypothetical protein